MKRFYSLLILLLVLIPVKSVFAVTVGAPVLVSKSTAGVQGNASSEDISISSNGRFVIFSSSATNLVAGDTNGFQDVFVRDTQLNTTTRISVSTAGTQGNDASWGILNITDDGRYIVFHSNATNLVAGDTNGFTDVFLRDTQLNTTTRVSISTAGTQGDSYSNGGRLSSDGRYVIFSSNATNLVAGDTNGSADTFIRDTQLNTTTRVSVANDGSQSDGYSQTYGMTTDGRYVVFSSDATNLVAGDTNGFNDVFVRDTQLNTTTRISVSTAGVETDAYSIGYTISSDGRYVAFQSEATNLVANDTNGLSDVFVRDTQLNTTTRVSISTAGVEGDGEMSSSVISDDGNFVLFSAGSTNLVANDTNASDDLFVRDILSNTTTRVSVGLNGNQLDNVYGDAVITNNGAYVVFISSSSNVVDNDTGGFSDAFLVGITYTTSPLQPQASPQPQQS